MGGLGCVGVTGAREGGGLSPHCSLCLALSDFRLSKNSHLSLFSPAQLAFF